MTKSEKKDCCYTFIEKEDCGQCPDCGKKNIRRATEKEELEYYRNRAEFTTEIKRYVLVATPYKKNNSTFFIEPSFFMPNS